MDVSQHQHENLVPRLATQQTEAAPTTSAVDRVPDSFVFSAKVQPTTAKAEEAVAVMVRKGEEMLACFRRRTALGEAKLHEIGATRECILVAARRSCPAKLTRRVKQHDAFYEPGHSEGKRRRRRISGQVGGSRRHAASLQGIRSRKTLY
eukprot:scaffold5443_cov291-Pinguiococcus_pyrenoidosus.AAC.7